MDYKSKHITWNTEYKEFSKNIGISLHVDAHSPNSYGAENECMSNNDMQDFAIYMLQTIKVQGKNLNLFYDTGCGDLVCRKSAIDILEKMGRANKIFDGPLVISGVGDQKSSCPHGIYSVKLPLANGKEVNLSGMCLDKITAEFPTYPLSIVQSDIERKFRFGRNDVKR